MITESRFAFLSKEYVELHQYCINAESDCVLNPTRSVQVARNAVEFIVTKIIGSSNEKLYVRMAKLKEINGEKKVPVRIWRYFNEVKNVGNDGAHAGSGNNEKVTAERAADVINELVMIAIWFYLKYEGKTCPKYCFAKQDYGTVAMFNENIVKDETGLSDEAAKILEKGKEYYKKGPNQDYKKALELFKKAADLNNAEAEYKTALIYYFGRGLEKPEYENAIYYFTRAAENGYADGYWRLGLCYYYGHGVEEDYSKAHTNFTIGTNKGSFRAMTRLGRDYYFGEGIDQDYDEAYRWWKTSSEKGYHIAEYWLGVYFKEIKKDEVKAMEYYSLAAADVPEAANALGKIYEKTSYNSKNMKKAIEMYLKAAASGIVEAQYKVGYLYYEKLRYHKDWTKEDDDIKLMGEAISWLEKASEKGYHEAEFLLGEIYASGLFVMKSLKKAYGYYKLAAEGGHIEAMLKAGELCRNNDCVTSFEWYMKAAKQESALAQGKVADHYFNNGEYEEAVYWYRKAAKQNDIYGIYCLSQCYRYGFGVDEDVAETINILKSDGDTYQGDAITFALYELYSQIHDVKLQARIDNEIFGIIECENYEYAPQFFDAYQEKITEQ